MPDIELTPDQEAAIVQIGTWRAYWPGASRQEMIVAGPAGTGKTTAVARVAPTLPGCVVVCPTGKAAFSVQCKGGEARTIHSLIYHCEKSEGKPRFVRKRHLGSEVGTIIVDEASMVTTEQYMDLMSFSVPVLFVGDHCQLEPIGEDPKLMERPDVTLTTIHRQAMSNPIIRLATAFREGKPVPDWRDRRGRLEIGRRGLFDEAMYQDGAQIIVGFNKTRHAVNAAIRNRLGFIRVPSIGDKIICLENNPKYEIFNGQQAKVLDIISTGPNVVEIVIETDDGRQFPCLAWREQFGLDKIVHANRVSSSKEILFFDFGYAISLHKAQGSEFDNVVILEEIARSWNANKWRYTGATRAKKTLRYYR